jgi:alkylation response protein AidB-like acyl-CoA dehydrogenase
MLRDAELFKLMQPARFGGFEYGFAELVDIIYEIAQGCGNTGWCAGIGIANQWFVAHFPLEAQEEVWEDPNTIVAASFIPAGKCEAASGGYRISGKWPFVSNCDNSDWYILGVMFPSQNDFGAACSGFVLVPRTETEKEDDWFAVGLAGTGSKSILIKSDIFVPEYRKITMAELDCAEPVHSDPVYAVPFLASLPVAHVCPALGIVRGAIDEFLEMAQRGETYCNEHWSGDQLVDFARIPHIQSRVGEASAAVDAARLLLDRDIKAIEWDAARGETVSLDRRLRNRRDHAYAVRLAVTAINTLFEGLGETGLYLGSGIQRAWRDINAIALHVNLNWDVVGTMYGQHRLGFEPKGNY